MAFKLDFLIGFVPMLQPERPSSDHEIFLLKIRVTHIAVCDGGNHPGTVGQREFRDRKSHRMDAVQYDRVEHAVWC